MEAIHSTRDFKKKESVYEGDEARPLFQELRIAREIGVIYAILRLL